MQSVRINPDDHKTLREIAEKHRRPMTEVLGEAIADLRRKFILEATNAAYAELRKDAKACAEMEKERRLWDRASLADGKRKGWK